MSWRQIQPLMSDPHFILFIYPHFLLSIFVVELDQMFISFHMESLYHEIKFTVKVKLYGVIIS